MLKKLLLLLHFLVFASLTFAQEFPQKSNTLVTDYTGTLSNSEKQQLEDKVVAFNDSTSTQLAIVLIKSVGDYDISQYGTMLIREWGIGQKGKNNGVLMLVAINDRKVTIQTGYGIEGALTDAATQQIIQKDLKPNFKAGNYYAGLNQATDHIIQYTKGEFKADPKAKRQSRNEGKGGSSGFIIIIVIVIIIIVMRNRGGGGGGQVIGRRGSASPFWWFLAGNMLGGSNRGGGDWGGFSGGGGFGGGGGGGFGGGSAGGGGSSGSW